ncbi:hypothetical protein DL98DRAFT_601950 [Cadophora sp. DSE1049]|nr:hypothetical protein DL98DRAFT_601950 [Cadophora sp. DSE1049]
MNVELWLHKYTGKRKADVPVQPPRSAPTARTNYEDEDDEEDYSDENGSGSGSDEEAGERVSGENKADNDAWDINGQWELECRCIANCFGQSSLYALEIYTTERDAGRDTCRGREIGQGVIQLREDSRLYTFSDGGKKMKGTWGVQDADPGHAGFTSFKTGENIQYEWERLNEDAYNRANRDRRRR